MTTRHFEDLEPGETHTSGRRRVTEAEIVAFAEAYDPQPIHVDAEAARGSPFGGLAASGWHTASVAMRLFVDALLDDVAVVAAAGIEDLRWRTPVRAGDELRLTATIADAEPWDDSKGLVTFDVAVRNGDDEPVLTLTELVLVGRRSA